MFIAISLSALLSVTFLAGLYEGMITNPGCNDFSMIQYHNTSCWKKYSSGATLSKVAVVKPVFTTSAYMSFYSFYRLYAQVPDNYTVKSDLNLLNTTAYDGWGTSFALYSFIQSDTAKDAGLLLGNNTFILTDIEVDKGGLFTENGSLRFGTVILGFEEYVTENEYLSLRNFVLDGGKLIILSGGNFLAEVKYGPATNTISLVKGHGWYFNGTEAIKSVYNRWYKENSEWVGSNYAYYIDSQHYTVQGAIANTSDPYSVLLRLTYGTRSLWGYPGHEENVITNLSDSVIAYWLLSGNNNMKGKVAIYELHAGRGVVYHMGIFGTDILTQNKEMQFLLLSFLGLINFDAYIYHAECKIGFMVKIKDNFILSNNSWKGIVSFDGAFYNMRPLNSSTFVYEANVCSSIKYNTTIYVYSGDFMGSYISI
jgi:hypothetical protein